MRSLTKTLRVGVRATDGAIAAEFALLVPLLLIFVFSVIFFGRVLWYQNALQGAVEDAARCYALARPLCDTPAEAQTYAANHTTGFTPTSTVYAATVGTCGTIPGRRVTAAFTVDSGIPFVPLSLTVRANACRAA